MLAGVIAFSMASGALTNYIAQQDNKSEEYEKRMGLLDTLFKEHKLPPKLYSRIRQNIEHNHLEDKKSVSQFVEDLPLDLKTPLSITIYRELYSNVDFLMTKDPQFIAWICPLLKLRVTGANEVVYYEGDAVEHVYFLKSGMCNQVLPMYGNMPFVQIVDHTQFGLIDIIAGLLDKDGMETGCMHTILT